MPLNAHPSHSCKQSAIGIEFAYLGPILRRYNSHAEVSHVLIVHGTAWRQRATPERVRLTGLRKDLGLTVVCCGFDMD